MVHHQGSGGLLPRATVVPGGLCLGALLSGGALTFATIGHPSTFWSFVTDLWNCVRCCFSGGVLSGGNAGDAVCRWRGGTRRQGSIRAHAAQQVRSHELRLPRLFGGRHASPVRSMFRTSSLPHRQPRGALLRLPQLSARPQVLRRSHLSLPQRFAKTSVASLRNRSSYHYSSFWTCNILVTLVLVLAIAF